VLSLPIDVHELNDSTQETLSPELTASVGLPDLQGAEEPLLPPPDGLPCLPDINQGTSTVEELVPEQVDSGAELIESTPRVLAACQEVEEPVIPLPIDVYEIIESGQETVSSELADATDLPVFEEVKEQLLALPVSLPDLADINQETSTVEEFASVEADSGAELVEAIRTFLEACQEVEEPVLLPIDVHDLVESTQETDTAALPVLQGAEEPLLPLPDRLPDMPDISQGTSTEEDLASEKADMGAELIEATPMVLAAFQQVEELALTLPIDVPELAESTQETVSAEFVEATDESAAMRHELVKTVGEPGEVEYGAVLVDQAEDMLQALACDSAEIAKQSPEHVAAINEPEERVNASPPPDLGSAASLDEVIKHDASATAQLLEGTETFHRPQGEWEDLCDCDGLSDAEDTLASDGFTTESGWRLAHDAVVLIYQDALDICDQPDFMEATAEHPCSNAEASLRIAAMGWSGMHALLFYMWSFSDHSATKELLLQIDVAFDFPPGTFIRKTESICHYWYKLLHSPPHPKTTDECARQMKAAFREVETVLLEYHQYHQEDVGRDAPVAGGTCVSTQADSTHAEVPRLVMHYAIWAIVPEICKAARDPRHRQRLARIRTHESTSIIEVFHAIGAVTGGLTYMLLQVCSSISCAESEAVQQAMVQLMVKCSYPQDSCRQAAAHASYAFWCYVMSMQRTLPGDVGTEDRVALLRTFTKQDEVFLAIRKYRKTQRTGIWLIENILGAWAGAAGPGPLKELVENDGQVSSHGRPRRSLGGA